MENKRHITAVLLAIFFSVTAVAACFLFGHVIRETVEDAGSMQIVSKDSHGLSLRAVNLTSAGEPFDGPNSGLSIPTGFFDPIDGQTILPYESFTFLKLTYSDGSEVRPVEPVFWSITAEDSPAKTVSGEVAEHGWKQGFSDIEIFERFWLDVGASDPLGLFINMEKVSGRSDLVYIGCRCPFFFPVWVTAEVEGFSVSCKIEYRRSSLNESLIELGFDGILDTVSVSTRKRGDIDWNAYSLRVPVSAEAFLGGSYSDLFAHVGGSLYDPDIDSDTPEIAEVIRDNTGEAYPVSFASGGLRRNSGVRYLAMLVAYWDSYQNRKEFTFSDFQKRELDFSDYDFSEFAANVLGLTSSPSFEDVVFWTKDDTSESDTAAFKAALDDVSTLFTGEFDRIPFAVKWNEEGPAFFPPLFENGDPYTMSGMSDFFSTDESGFYTFDAETSRLSDAISGIAGDRLGSWTLWDLLYFPGVPSYEDAATFLTSAAEAYLADPAQYEWCPLYYLKVGGIVLGIGPDFSGGPFGYQGGIAQ